MLQPHAPLGTRRRAKAAAAAPALSLLCLLAAPAARAQANASITGVVLDSSGAVIGGAEITVTNEETGVATRVRASSGGVYQATGLNPGTYDVLAVSPGFKELLQTGVRVEVSTPATINATLSPGKAAEEVSVRADGIALNTTQPQLGTTIEPEVQAALPQEIAGRGRQIDTFQFLAPGVQGSGYTHFVSGGLDFSQEVLFNGIPYPQAETQGFTTISNPPYELVREFRVERTSFAAQFGLGQGAISYQLAPGTNAFHGDVFEINRNSSLDSRGFFNPKVPFDHENNYGYTLGGPVWIPKVYDGRKRTFFHVSQEWFKQNQENTSFGTVPTALEKTGDFSDFLDPNTGALIPIYDPQTGQQFSYNGRLNVIPPSRISPLSASLLKYIPDPDRRGDGASGISNNKLYFPFSNPIIQHSWGFNIDHTLSDRQSLHYSQWRTPYSDYQFQTSPIVGLDNPLNSLLYRPELGTGFLLSYNDLLTPSLSFSAGLGWFGELNEELNQTRYNFPGAQQSVILPNITFDGQNAPTQYGAAGGYLNSVNRKLGIAIVNNWIWVKGRHTFNFGGEFRRTYQDDHENQSGGGQFNFSQRTTSTPGQGPGFQTNGSSFASFLLGQADSASRGFSPELRLRNVDLSPYVQDDIKFTPKLTVNLGLRWDLQFPFTENDNQIVFFDPTLTNPAAGGLPGAVTQFGHCALCSGFTRASVHLGHFGPRVGVGYQIDQKTVLQSAYSLVFLNGGAYEYGTSKVAVSYGNLLAGQYQRVSTHTNTPGYGSWDANPLVSPGPGTLSRGLGVGNQVNAFSQNDGYAPYVQQWNANVQRQLPFDTLLTAAYVGTRVIHEQSQLNRINQPDPAILRYGSLLGQPIDSPAVAAAGFHSPYPNFVNDFGSSATLVQALQPFPQYSNVYNNFEGSGTSFYQGLQVQGEKRFTNGLAFLLAYTLSHSMSNEDTKFQSFVATAENKFNQRQEWSTDTADEPNNFKLSGTYELPIGPGKKLFNNHGITGEVLGGWQASWILDYESGGAFGVGENGSPWPNGFNRPDRVPSVPLGTASYNREKAFFLGKGPAPNIFNPAAFQATPSQYVLGNAQRTYSELRQPPFRNENVTVSKYFALGERVRATVRADFFNALNRTKFNGPDNNANSGTFGQARSSGQANANRQGQLTARVEF